MSTEESQFRLIEIDVTNGDEDRIVGLFRCDPVGASKNGPQIVIIADIHSTLYVYERLLDTITSTAEQARRLVSGVDQDPIGRFEKLVERINQAVAEFTQAEPSQLNWQRINIFVVELSNGHMCMTGTGELMNLFLQKQEDGTLKGFDLLGSLEQPRMLDPAKPFAGLICGDIAPGDIFMIGTGNLERERAELRIRERLTSLPAVTAALEIRQDLEKRNIGSHAVAAIMCCVPGRKPSPISETPTDLTSTESIEKLRTSETDAETRLAPVATPIPVDIKAWFTQVKEQLENMVSEVRERWMSRRRVQPNDPETMKLASLRGMNAGYGSSFTDIQKKKAAQIGGGILIILLVIGFISHYRTSKAEQTAWDGNLAQAGDLRGRAESDAIFGNDTRAQQEYAEAERILTSLAQDSDDRKSRVSALRVQMDELKKRLQKTITFSSVSELTLLPPGTAEKTLRAPILTNDTAYAVDTNDGSVIKVSITAKSVKRIPVGDRARSVTRGSIGGNAIVFATTDGNLISIAKSDDKPGDIPWTHSQASTTLDAILYRSRIYALEPSKNQIWRSSQSAGGFGSETGYVKAGSSDLQQAIRIAIGTDGTMNVLQQNGTVVRYLNGGQEGYALSAIEPTLTSASDIWGSVDDPNIYVVDPINKRIVAFDATGHLTAQYTSNELKNPQQVFVDPANKRMLIIDENRLLLAQLP